MILEIASHIGLIPKRVAATHGGEYVCECPYCHAGKDRFHIWPERLNSKGVAGIYWCRVCGKCGDIIQLSRDFFDLTYFQACKRLGIATSSDWNHQFKSTVFSPNEVLRPTSDWQKVAQAFVKKCHHNFLHNEAAITAFTRKRGLNRQAVEKFQIGWNLVTMCESRQTWGLPPKKDKHGKESLQWLPRGIVIPIFEGELINKIKIRRQDWHEGDLLPKYIEISGSAPAPSYFGCSQRLPCIILEAELDAMLLCQDAGDLCSCIALGGVSKKPDKQIDAIIWKAPLLLCALDFDQSGIKHYRFWKETYPHLKPWPTPHSKSPGDAFKDGLNVRLWIETGLEYYKFGELYA